MRLVSLAVWSWRGLDHVALRDLAPDLNLVVGPNESGKSRLFEALRFALFERYKGESEEKRALRTWGSSESPRVEVTFDAEGARYTLTKQFLKQAYARLEGAGRTLTDDDAEARVRELWGTRAIQGRRDVEQFLGLWPLLWVRQGFATSAPHADLNDDTRARLRDALSAQVDEVAAGPRGERVVARTERERERYWTATWKETGELALARARKLTADEAREREGARRAEAHGAADELSRVATELEVLEARARLQRARVAESLGRVARAREASERLRAQETQMARLAAESELAERSSQALRAAEERLASLEAEIAAEKTALAQRRVEEATLEARETLESEALRRAETAREAAHLSHVRARRRAQVEVAARSAEAARGMLDRARTQVARLDDVKRRLLETRIDEPRIARLRKAHEAFARASAALAAASARVTVRATRDLVIDGEALGEGRARDFRCDAPTTLIIEGVARIEVRPGGAELDAHRDREGEARRALEARLEDAGATSLSEAEEAYARRTGLDALRTQAEHLVKEAAPAGLTTLEDELRARDAEMAALRLGASDEGAPSLAEADQALHAAEGALARSRAARDALKEARLGVHDQASRREQALTQLEKQRGEAHATAGAMGARDALEKAEAAARAAWLAAAALAEALRAELTRAGGDDAQLALEQDGSALRITLAELAMKTSRGAVLEAMVQIRGGEDLHERVQRAEAEADEADRALRVTMERALSVRALAEALAGARREVQERLLAPVLSHVEPYLQALLPGARLRMDEDWSVLGLEAANREEDFEALSGGAKEQVSILVRLALAEVLAGARGGSGGGGREKGGVAADDGLPVVLDDALVNTDAERHADMLRILFKASKKQQILLFSCHDVPWAQLGETRRFELLPRRARGR